MPIAPRVSAISLCYSDIEIEARSLVKGEIAMESQIIASVAQIRMARAGLKITFASLAERADVSTNTLTRIENGEPVRPRTVAAVQGALEAAGARFVEDASHVGVMLPRETAPGSEG